MLTVENLKCCGNCGNTFLGTRSTNGISGTMEAVKLCKKTGEEIKDGGFCCYSWEYDGKTEEERGC